MKQFKLAITFGRFNLLHNGHLDLFQQMAESAEEVTVGLSTGPGNLDSGKRVNVINKAYGASDIDLGVSLLYFHKFFKVKLLRQPFDLLTGLEDIEPERVVFYVGEDQFKLAKAIERVAGFQIRTIPRLTSSTIIRQAVDNEDWDLVSTLVPPSVVNDVINLHLKQNA